ncbi:hypothetical protein A8B82_02785 [Sulfitobacter sp. EhC04]|uniref:hypothetical protein n=1 Tax=Sulfitobacter sp. EhC04 TaxID=1849168 RepID=UPI0007F3541E|nr:hypothetical protein [Sulfitobacter sp. EhC04]OAN73443.1 hypothetical protein A8B82_02785 [Sulfitobacter sp. EhC04]
MSKVLSLLAVLSTPQADALPKCDTAQTVQGSTVYCCSLTNGQQCCSGSLDSGSKPAGCGC